MGLCGETHAVLGTVELPSCINHLMVYHKFHVFQRLHRDIILGLNFLEQNNAPVVVFARVTCIPRYTTCGTQGHVLANTVCLPNHVICLHEYGREKE